MIMMSYYLLDSQWSYDKEIILHKSSDQRECYNETLDWDVVNYLKQ